MCKERRERRAEPCSRTLFALMAVCGLCVGMLGETTVGGAPVASQNEASAADTAFPDVTETDWFYPYVTQLYADGYVKGRDTGLYDPQGKLTVAEASTMIVRYLGLENAAENRKARLEKNAREGSEKWYAGYIQIMYEAGLVSPDEYVFNVKSGDIVLKEGSRFDAYITREAFARMVSGSFRLDDTQLRSNTPLDPEHLGHGFEVPYTYSEETVSAYKNAINDFDSIPEASREAVLRSYMNGIFMGDGNGNFNPFSNLTRAEMAKVVTVVLHRDMRTWAEVALPVSNDVPGCDPHSADVSGNTIPTEATPSDGKQPGSSEKPDHALTCDEIADVLESESAGLSSTKNSDGSGTITFRSKNSVPKGYALKIYHFVNAGGGYDSDMAAIVNNDGSTYYSCASFGGDRIVLALEEEATGETLGTRIFQFTADGRLADLTEQYLP